MLKRNNSIPPFAIHKKDSEFDEAGEDAEEEKKTKLGRSFK